ncbi:MAG: hypothetical protein AAFW84_09745 [Cyanobacteria bacterium J06635_15]
MNQYVVTVILRSSGLTQKWSVEAESGHDAVEIAESYEDCHAVLSVELDEDI